MLQVRVHSSSSSGNDISASELSRLLQWEWLKNGNSFSNSDQERLTFGANVEGGVLVINMQISGALENDSAAYSCRVVGGLGQQHIASFAPVSVLGVDVRSVGYPTNSSFFVGLELDLSCQVSLSHGFSRELLAGIEVSWTRQGASLDESHDHISLSSTVQPNSSVSNYHRNISFLPLVQGDGGTYVCTATCRLRNGLDFAVNHSRTLLVDSK